MTSNSSGEAKIKPEFLVKITNEVGSVRNSGNLEDGPAIKKIKIQDEEDGGGGDAEDKGNTDSSLKEVNDDDEGTIKESSSEKSKDNRSKTRGQNKNRPQPFKYLNSDKLCPTFYDGQQPDSKCSNLERCPFMHDVDKYIASKKEKAEGECYIYTTYGKCSRGLTCLFASSHIDLATNINKVDQDKWTRMESLYEHNHKQLLDRDTQNSLRKHKYDFKVVDNLYSQNIVQKQKSANMQNQTCGALTDEDSVKLRPSEVKKLDWKDKLYLSPLTTVGNLPFRRLCVEMGADITCSEMSLATSILQGNMHEFALHRRHPSEKFWGIQLCASNGILAAKASHVLAESGIDYDFVDLNMGCPLDPIYRQGAGSGLMCRTNKFQTFVRGMTSVLSSRDKPFTVKMRTGIKMDKNIAHSLIEFCRDNGVAAVTLHGRSREQRYLKYADWNYIGECAKIASPMALFGNGDIISYKDYLEKKAISNVTGVMIGRGALIKPWVFQEIKEQRNIDMSSSERLELIRKYAHYGLDHWGSDSQGVATTRKFLLEWLSFYHRYIPFGILEDPPQRINDRPPKYFGRDDMETLLASSNSLDWIKISEMFLGPVHDNFNFVPKHRANAWSNG